MTNKQFNKLSEQEKNKFVHSGNGQRLTKLQSEWKTRDWPIMKMIKSGIVPKDNFGQLAYNLFR